MKMKMKCFDFIAKKSWECQRCAKRVITHPLDREETDPNHLIDIITINCASEHKNKNIQEYELLGYSPSTIFPMYPVEIGKLINDYLYSDKQTNIKFEYNADWWNAKTFCSRECYWHANEEKQCVLFSNEKEAGCCVFGVFIVLFYIGMMILLTLSPPPK